MAPEVSKEIPTEPVVPNKEALLNTEDKGTQETPNEYSEQEQLAMDSGWVPKTEWKGKEEDWRPAKEFNDRGELFSRIKDQSKQLQELKQAMQYLTGQQAQQFQAGFKDALQRLKAQRSQARENGDHQQIDVLDDKIDEVKDHIKKVEERTKQQPQSTAGPSSEFMTWRERNDWYTKDKVLTRFADSLGLEFRESNPNSNENEMLQHVSKEVRKEFPSRFQPKGPPSPDGNGRGTRGEQGNSTNTQFRQQEGGMTEEEKSIMKTILKSTGMTKEQYMKQYTGG